MASQQKPNKLNKMLRDALVRKRLVDVPTSLATGDEIERLWNEAKFPAAAAQEKPKDDGVKPMYVEDSERLPRFLVDKNSTEGNADEQVKVKFGKKRLYSREQF